MSQDVSLKGFIDLVFGGQRGLDRHLGLTDRTTYRYYNKTPNQLMTHHKQLRDSIDLNLLSRLIEQRELELLDRDSNDGGNAVVKT